MHLIFVSSLVPVENPTSGFDIANRAVLDGLRALGHKVSVIGYVQPGQTPAAGSDVHLLGEIEVANARVGAVKKAGWLARAFLSGLPLSAAKMLNVSRQHVEALVEKLRPFDGIVLNSVQLPAAFLPVFARHPTLYIAHNVEASAALENAAAARDGSIERLLFAREARHLEACEQALAQAATGILTFAQADRFGFGYKNSDKARVLPLVTQWAAPPAPAIAPPRHDLGLIGTWSWKPNRIGLDWFLDAVVPLLPHDMTIAIAGQLSGNPVVRHPGVRFLGRVADARGFVTESGVIPLVARGGSGVQLKTIETFELGMPSVATPDSVRGIEAVPSNCLRAADPATFAKLLVHSVTAVRAGAYGRISGSVFHQAQKSALLHALNQSLSVFQSHAAFSGNRQETRRVANGQPVTLVVHEGGAQR